MATIRVHTTQNVTLEYEVASLGDRIVATLIDYLILFAWTVLVFVAGISLFGNHSQTLLWLIWMLAGIPFIFYWLLSEIFFNGQTLGKKARQLRVIRLDGTAPRIGDYLLRWLLRLVDFGLGSGLVAVIAVAASGKGQRLGDMAAGTSVISLKPRYDGLPAVASPAVPVGYQPVFAQAADLSDHDVALLNQLLGRSLQQHNYLLLNETANKIKQLLHVQSDLSDEAFLRTVLRDHAFIVAERG
jgi:uncharacterized RDD family membrane protein YckC